MRGPLFAALSTTLLASALSLYPSTASGQGVCGQYTLAFYELGALYYRNAAGEHVGIDKDVVDELSRRSGCKFSTVVESRVRIWDQLAKHKLDLSVSGIATPERQQFAEFLPYFQTRNFALLRRDLAATIMTPDAFLADPLRRVAVVKSFKHGPVFDAWLAQLRGQRRVEELPDFDSVLRVFKAGRVDAMLALPTSLARVPGADPMLDQISIMDWAPNDSIAHALIVSRERVSPADLALLRAGLQSMQKDGALEAIFRRHVDSSLAHVMRLESP
ncbi:substrate-binding periplasmic protein [Roseateles albus]|uniref:Transporter substrate-binding domain-containing protein n=1 Tax=Roseateles albus TaxID=2987525 RepID=A0ABT5KEB2_9BURK|nr:transporter substrate-binding domain-containing protein [Roseateles albus]MDC8772265.1 transporter substrate-binding domain-containing protein [Roseateles albus]